MDRQLIKEKLFMRIRPLVLDPIQAIDFADWYLLLGPRRVVTILRELIAEDAELTRDAVGDSERKLLEVKIAKSELEQLSEKVVGE